MPRSQKYNPRFHLIASYSDGDKILAIRTDVYSAFDMFSDLVSFRLRGYMTFRSLRLVHPATKRVYCEYIDYRYLEQAKPFEKLYPFNN